MFDQNDQNQQAATTTAPVSNTVQNTTTPDIADPNLTANPGPSGIGGATIDPTVSNTPSAPIPQDTSPSPAPSAPDLSMASASQPTTPSPTPDLTTTTISPTEPMSLPNNPGSDDLLNIKKNALQNLTPLLDHLDQSPEEKFRTTMMLIQASDDQSLVQSAYSAAQSITDEKVKAQALLDIINEINYFTQESKKATETQ